MLLFINACVRSDSRTLKLSDALLKKLGEEYVEVKLEECDFPVANEEAPVLFKIRHVAELRSGRLTRRADGSYHLQMDAKTNGVAPGQFCVIYTPDVRICLGSGEIAWE